MRHVGGRSDGCELPGGTRRMGTRRARWTRIGQECGRSLRRPVWGERLCAADFSDRTARDGRRWPLTVAATWANPQVAALLRFWRRTVPPSAARAHALARMAG